MQQAILNAQEYADVDGLRKEPLSLLSESQHILTKAQQKTKEEGKSLDKSARKKMHK